MKSKSALQEQLLNYVAKPMMLANKVIVITGASGSLGQVLAMGYAKLGAQLILMGKNQKKLASLQARIAKVGLVPEIICLDFVQAKPQDFQLIADKILEKYAVCHGLVHLAVQLKALSPIEHIKSADFAESLAVSVNSAFYLSQSLLPLLKKAPKAVMIFNTGLDNPHHLAYWGAYTPAKYALQGLKQVLAAELEHNTRIKIHGLDFRAIGGKLRKTHFPAEAADNLPSPEIYLPVYLSLFDEANTIGRAQDFTYD